MIPATITKSSTLVTGMLTPVVDLMKENNPNCFIVHGSPRTPRDQGSVESANKLVQRVMKSMSSEHHLAGLKVNWTRFLGQVMAVCNSHSRQKKYCISNYEAVFGQKYHPILKCSLAEMRECRSISQRLWLSTDERLKKYVRENDIVKGKLSECHHQTQLSIHGPHQ
jgi:hypothetical protein